MASLLLVGCGGSEGGDNPPTPGSEVYYESQTFNFINCSIHGTYDTDAKMTEFKEWFNNQESITPLETFSCSGMVQIQALYGEDSQYILSLGSQKNTGEMNFEFKYALNSVTVTARAYSKYNSYNQVWNIDSESKLYLDDNLIDLSTSATTFDEMESISYTYDEYKETDEIKALTLSTAEEGKRVFIESLTLEWRVPIEE